MSKEKESSKQNVVVVGGGAGGLIVAQELSAKLNHDTHNLILVEARPHNIHIIAGLRIVVSQDKKYPGTVVFPYDRVFKEGKGTVKHARVVGIIPNETDKGGELTFADGETLPYHVLVLATGSHWQGPLAFPNDKAEFHTFVDTWREKFKVANDITVVGGGAVGIELVGELRDQYPKKKITLVHDLPRLLNPVYHDRFRKRMEEQIRGRNIDVVLNEFVESFPEGDSGEIKFRSGNSITTDLVVRAMGPKPNTEFIGSSLGEEVLTDRKFVKVTPKLQLPDHPSIFALLDIIDWPEQKQAAKANKQVPVVVANVLSYIADKPPAVDYKGMPELILITNGKDGGLLYLPFLWGIVLGPFFARFLKSKTLLVEMVRPRMGY